MNKLFFALALLFVGMSASAQHLGTEYRLKRVIPVAGRQGIAIDSNYYYVSDTKVLYKYDKQGNLVMKNDQPSRILKLLTILVILTCTMGRSIVVSRNSNTDVVTILPCQFMTQRL